MKLKLLAPAGSLNWMLLSEELNDPADWSQFLLNHGPGTDRYCLEEAVQKASGEHQVVVIAYRLLCKRGQSGLEYAWQSDPRKVKAHALRVAELLGTDIQTPDAEAARLRAG